jgi:tRNA(Arg) A34 adenosine deaminase TadA
MTETDYMNAALEEAKKAALRDEVPIGAVLVHAASGQIAAANGNRTIELRDPTAHAEILVIREMCDNTGAQRIPEYDLYVTLEPCAMCAAAISFARIRCVVFAALDPKGGGVRHGGKFYEQPTCHHRPEVQYLDMPQAGQILRDYFKGKRGI